MRKQLAFCQEHQIKPKPLTEVARFSLVFWSQWFNWREAFGDRQTWDSDPGASQGVHTVLGLEIEKGKASTTDKDSAADRAHGEREPHLGRRTDSGGIVIETGDRGLPADSAGILAFPVCPEASDEDRFAAVENVPPQSRSVDCGVRFSGVDNREFPNVVCAGHPGSGEPSDSVAQRDGPSHGRMDCPYRKLDLSKKKEGEVKVAAESASLGLQVR